MSSIYCSQCGSKHQAGAKFCSSCGNALSALSSQVNQVNQIADVEVDIELGTVKVLRIAAAHDVGQSLNPQQVEGQIHGGVAQGLGFALMEEYIPGRTENLHDYLIPTIGDIPDIKTYIIEDPEPTGPWGAKGIGEPALCATAPAIFGGIHQATGVRVNQAPCTPDRLRASILNKNA